MVEIGQVFFPFGGAANRVLADRGTYFFPNLKLISNVVVFTENNTSIETIAVPLAGERPPLFSLPRTSR